MSKILNLNKNVIANKVKQSDEIATPYGLAMTSYKKDGLAMTESGRSMVEMLGVLAVMGILSVAGIAGYNAAMNQHRANELINEASKRATIVAMQIASGRETASLAEFRGHSVFAGGSFDDNVEIKLENNRFKIAVNNLLPEVCRQVKNTVGINTTIRKVVCSTKQIGTGIFWFNSDLNSKDPQGDLCDAINNIYCDYGQICTTSGQVAGTCVNKEEDWECLTNEDCSDKPNTFCEILTQGHSIVAGQCSDIGASSGEIETPNWGILEASENTNMNYWTARNWCQIKNKKLIDISGTRLECYNGDIPLVLGNRDAVGKMTDFYCCKKGETDCQNKENQSQMMVTLNKKFGGKAYWTNTSANQWMGFRIASFNGISGDIWYYAPYYSALCE